MKLLTPNRSNQRRLNCAAMGMVLLLVTFVSPDAGAFPLSRFTERVSGSLINEFGQDDNLAENIVVNRPGFFGKAETSGNNGAVLPGGSGGPSAEAILDIAGDQGGVVSAFVTYYFGVAGPALAGAVPVIIDAVLLVEAEPHGVITTDTAGISVGDGVMNITRTLSGCSGLPEVCQDRRQDLVFNLGMFPGVEGTIFLSAILQARGAGEGVRIRAVADPFIRIDPTFEFADLYQIIVSSNVSNTPPDSQAVPEGSTLSLLSVGLVALTFLGRSKWGARRPRGFRNGALHRNV